MKKEVVWASFHETLFFTGLGQMGNTLPSPSRNYDVLVMQHESEGLAIKIRKGARTVEGLIPWANVKNVEYSPEDPKSASKAA